MQRESDYQSAVNELAQTRVENKDLTDCVTLQESIQGYIAYRKQRTETFLQRLYARRAEILEKLQPVNVTKVTNAS